MIEIRAEVPADYDAIRDINNAAFAGNDESEIIDLLRTSGDVLLSLIALDNLDPVGHILFSRLGLIASDRAIKGAALAPIAVVPGRQNQGIGMALVRAGIDACTTRAIDAIVVLGHPNFFPRFGFTADLARNLKAPFSGDAFMALELTPGILAGEPATVRYANAFGLAT